MSYDGTVRFLYNNLITSVSMMTADTQAGSTDVELMELVSGTGAAVGVSVGPYTGTSDRTLTCEIDSVSGGTDVGEATFKWRWNDTSGWAATGVTTSATFITLGYGVKVKWSSHATLADFALGDRFEARVSATYSPQNLIDGNLNTIFQSTAVDHLVINLGSAQAVTAFALRHHNLVAGQSTCDLQAHTADVWTSPDYDQALTITDPLIDYPVGISKQYWRLNPTDGALSYVQYGELFLGTYLELTDRAVFGTVEGPDYRAFSQESEWGLFRQTSPAHRRTFAIRYERLLPADITSLRTMQAALWNSTTGTISPCFVHLFSDDGGDTLIFADWVNWAEFQFTHEYLMPTVPDLVFREQPLVMV